MGYLLLPHQAVSHSFAPTLSAPIHAGPRPQSTLALAVGVTVGAAPALAGIPDGFRLQKDPTSARGGGHIPVAWMEPWGEGSRPAARREPVCSLFAEPASTPIMW